MSNVVLYPVVQLNNEVIVLLGCSTPYLQNQRVNSVLTYIETTTSPVTLYFSGGSKDCNTESESSIMQRRIHKLHPNVNIYIDPESKNTVENFVNLNNWMQETENSIAKVIIATSDFHKERAEKIFNLIVEDIKFYQIDEHNEIEIEKDGWSVWLSIEQTKKVIDFLQKQIEQKTE